MKAIVVHELGGPEVMRYEEVPEPTPGPAQVLVRVRAAGVNFADHLMRRGAYRGQQPPLTPGLELAGEVAALGPDVNDFRPGQRVFGWAPATYAEFAVASADRLLPMPSDWSFAEAAVLPVVYGTAWVALSDLARVRAGERVLVHAAGSGVGTAAIQIADALGASVLATAGADWKLERAREIGADATLNYQATADLGAEIARLTASQGVDVVLEGVGRATFGASLAALAPTGRMVVYGSPSGARVEFDTRLAIFKNLSIFGLALTAEPRAGTSIQAFRSHGLPFLAQHDLRPVIHRVFPLAEAAEAHRILLGREQFGKLVLAP